MPRAESSRASRRSGDSIDSDRDGQRFISETEIQHKEAGLKGVVGSGKMRRRRLGGTLVYDGLWRSRGGPRRLEVQRYNCTRSWQLESSGPRPKPAEVEAAHDEAGLAVQSR